MEKQKSASVSKAEENLARVTGEALETLRIWQFVEKSREETPAPKVLTDLRSHYDEIQGRKREYIPGNPEDFDLMFKADEILIRMLASSDRPIDSIFLLAAFEINEQKLSKQLGRREVVNLVDKRIVVWADAEHLALSREVREQFK